MLLGKWKSQPLRLVAENDQDEREYLSLRSLLSLPTEDFHLLSRGVEINHFLKTHQFCGKCGQKAEQTCGSMYKLWLSHLSGYLSFHYRRRSSWYRDFISQP